MTDVRFDARLERVLGRYANSAVVPIDPVAIASGAIRAGGRERREVAAIRRSRWLLVAATVSLLIALLGYALLSGGGPSPRTLGSDASTARPTTTPRPTLNVVTYPPSSATYGSWLADRPENLTFGQVASPARMALSVTPGPIATIDLVDGTPGLFPSSVATFGVGEMQFESTADGDSASLDGTPLAACATGDQGHYQSTVSGVGLLLTLVAISEDCPSRQAVLARTWSRSLRVANGGGIGVVDAIGPLFTVTLPAGGYAVDLHTDNITIHQDFPELQFLAWKDPQGFIDPCDRSKGRYAVERGPDAFVAYYRQLDGFTVDSTERLTIDGFPAVRLVIHANPDASCPDGKLWEYVPKAETGSTAWFIAPGVTDSLVLVDHPAGMLMFEVLPAPNEQEDQIVSTIRFLDHLPTQP